MEGGASKIRPLATHVVLKVFSLPLKPHKKECKIFERRCHAFLFAWEPEGRCPRQFPTFFLGGGCFHWSNPSQIAQPPFFGHPIHPFPGGCPLRGLPPDRGPHGPTAVPHILRALPAKHLRSPAGHLSGSTGVAMGHPVAGVGLRCECLCLQFGPLGSPSVLGSDRRRSERRVPPAPGPSSPTD